MSGEGGEGVGPAASKGGGGRNEFGGGGGLGGGWEREREFEVVGVREWGDTRWEEMWEGSLKSAGWVFSEGREESGGKDSSD